MTKVILKLIPLVFAMLYVAQLSAQSGLPSGCSGGTGGTGSAPIDGGVSALLIGAGALGYKHLKKNKKTRG